MSGDPGARIGVGTLEGVDRRILAALNRLSLQNASDLLWHIPARYEQVLSEQSITETDAAVTGSEIITVRGEIAAVRTNRSGGKGRTEATLTDGTTTVRLIWFNAPWMARKLHPGELGVAHGKCSRYKGYLQITNAQWTPLDPTDENAPRREGRLRAIYPTTEDLSQDRIERLIAPLLLQSSALLVDWLPEWERTRQGLPTLAEAMRMIHAPTSREETLHGRRRLAYDELYLLQLAIALRRAQVRVEGSAVRIDVTPAIHAAILKRLPFSLTEDQQQATSEIARDLNSTIPMNRLLQGDVGSGKTAVAVYALLAAVASGHQGAIIAPTEILAEQHTQSLKAMLVGAPMEFALLTGSTPTGERARILAGLADGSIPLVVGTHALLGEAAVFKKLAVVIIDEQHRFGVAQRAALRSKGLARAVHVLVMTATPIPRTLAMAFFGDLDVSTIRHSPPGRQPVLTRVVGFDKSDDVYRYVRTRIDMKEQCFVVVPAVEESDMGLADVAGTVERLARTHFSGIAIGSVHGQMSAVDRDRAMEQFRSGSTRVLVATVVIEVGVDIPAASLMVVEHAERFGLAQLHQLRGRVGRGEIKSLCVFIADATTDDSIRRMEVIGQTSDGFRIAEADLSIRGSGELFGERQSGLPPFRVADLFEDGPLLELARHDATARVERSPQLSSADERLVRTAVQRQYGATLGLSDMG